MPKPGRPRKELDQEMFEELCNIQCTETEICAVLRVSEKTLSSWCVRTYGDGFSLTRKKLGDNGKKSLRRVLWTHAQKSAAAAIFLSKNYLGMRDNPIEISEVSAKVDGLSAALEALAAKMDADGQ